MNRRVMAVTAAAVMSMSGFAVPAMADEEEAVSIQISASIMSMDPLIGGDSTNVAVIQYNGRIVRGRRRWTDSEWSV